MARPASARSLLALNAYWVGLSFMWNALHPIVLPALLVQFVPPDKKNTYLGLLTFSGLLIAMIVQPISGAISDRWASRFGRRRPLIAIGTLFDFVFLAILAASGGFGWLLLGYVGLQVSSNTAQGPLQALLRDKVPQARLGVASSVKVFLDLLSLVSASVIAGRLMRPGGGGSTQVFVVIAGLLFLTATITILLSGESPHDAQPTHHVESPGSLEADTSSYWWLIAQRGLFLLGIYGLQAFGQYYLQDALQVRDPAQRVSELLAWIGASTMMLVLVGGGISDRWGARRLLFVASGLAAAGMLLMALVTDLTSLYLAGIVLGAGIGSFMTSNWALANRLAPVRQAGRYLGLTNLATAGAGALARLEGPAVDALNAASPEAWLGYKGIFIFGAICILLSAVILMSKVREDDRRAAWND